MKTLSISCQNAISRENGKKIALAIHQEDSGFN
jgi:hypothetical protein